MITIGLILTALNCYAALEPTVKIAPVETDELFANPGMGWQTFHRFADEDKNLEGLPSSSAYFRFYWSEIEPVEGQIDFAKFDELLSHAKKAGQKLAFRVMCAGTSRDYMYVPQWLKDKGCKGFEYQRQGAIKHWVPDMDDPIFLEAHFRLIEELGNRYDGHPDLDLLDIGSVGLWGEWHMSGTGVDVPSLETRLAIIDAWCKAFPRTPRVMLIGDLEGMKHATGKRGCGWRADCMGDMGGFSKTWSHMKDMYPQQIERTNARDVWKTAPVAFESCWDMRKWKEEGWDIRYIFDYALSYHASYLNNKSARIPEGTRGEVERFLKRIGYRLVLRQMEHEKSAAIGSSFSISMIWENVGVAPPYRDYLLAFRLTSLEDGVECIIGKNSIKGWLPGKFEITELLEIPNDLKPGTYELALSIVDPITREPTVRLAIEGCMEDGWYPLSKVEIKTR